MTSTGFARWAVALSGWNLFVWGGRLRNLFADPGGLAGANRWSLAGSVLFSLASVVVLVVWLLERRRGTGGGDQGWLVAMVMAAGGVVIWAYRGLAIVGRDYSAGFIAVHSVLALVSIALGLAVLWTGRRPRLVS